MRSRLYLPCENLYTKLNWVHQRLLHIVHNKQKFRALIAQKQNFQTILKA